MSKDTGGPAFPCEQHETQDGQWNQSFDPGMSLRDYFAAKAMAGVISGPLIDGFINGLSSNDDKAASIVAFVSYELADAMLKERAK